MSEALMTWRNKLDFFQKEEGMAVDPEQKFNLAERIKEAKSRIAELEATPLSGGKASDAIESTLLTLSGSGQEQALKGLAIPQLGSSFYLVVPGQSPAQSSQPKPRLEDLFEIITDPDDVPKALFRTEAGRKAESALVPYQVGYVQGREGVNDVQEAIGKALGEAQGRLLVFGAAGIGKTREVAEFARKRCARDWKICIALGEGDGRLGELAALPAELADAKIVLIIDNLHSRLLARADSSPPYAERLEAFLTSLARQVPDNLLVIAMAHSESHFQRELGLDVRGTSWGSFGIYRLPEFTLEGLQQLLAGLGAQANVAIDERDISKLVENSDRKPRTLFINVNLARKEAAPLTKANWGPNEGDLWKESFRTVKGRHPAASQVYAALRLLGDAGLPKRKPYVAALSGALAAAATTAAIDALVDKGLLGLRQGMLTSFSEEQLQELLQEANHADLALSEHWESVISAVKDVPDRPPEWQADLVALTFGLNRHQVLARAEEVASLAIAENTGSARAYIARAGSRFLRADWSGSENDLTAALERDPNDADAHFIRGVTRQMLGDFSGAATDMDNAIKHGRKDSLAYSSRGQALFNQRQFLEAEADFSAAIATGEYDPNVSFLRGMARYQLSDFAGAEEDLTAALDHGLDFVQMMGPLQTIESGYMEQAIQQLQGPPTPPSHKDDALLYGLRGFSRLMQAKHTEAEADLTLAIKHGFSACIARMGKILQTTTLPLLASAKEQFANAEAQFGSDAPLYHVRGEVRAGLTRFAEAEADFDEAIRLGWENVEVFFLRGKVLLSQGKLPAAEADSEVVIERTPNDPQGYFLRGAVRFDQGNFAGAEEDLTAGMQRGQEDGPVYFLRGAARYQLRKLAEAESDLDLAIEKGKDDAVSYSMRAATRIDNQKYGEAEQDIEQAIARGRNDAWVYFVRGMARYHQQKLREAEADLSRALEMGKTDFETYSLRGAARLAQENWAEAEKDFTAAIEGGRDDSDVFYARGRARLGQQKFAESEGDFGAAIARGMDDADTYLWRGRARLGQGKWPETEADLETALTRGLDDAPVHYVLGLTRLELERYSEAERDFDAALARDRDYAASYHERGRARLIQGKMESAEQDFDSAIAGDPENLLTYHLRGLSRHGQGNFDGAITDYDTALAKGKPDAAILGDRVSADLRLGRLDEAEKDCARVTELGGDSPEAHGAQGMLQMVRGDFAGALNRFQSASEAAGGKDWHFWLGLAHLLAGDTEAARAAYARGMAESVPGDVLIALGHLDFWTTNNQERVAADEARRAVAEIRSEMAGYSKNLSPGFRNRA